MRLHRLPDAQHAAPRRRSDEIVKDNPTLEVTTDDLENGDAFANLDEQGRLLWDRTWTEVKAS